MFFAFAAILAACSDSSSESDGHVDDGDAATKKDASPSPDDPSDGGDVPSADSGVPGSDAGSDAGPPVYVPKATIIYLSQKGNDTNDGRTREKPKRTFDAAIEAAGSDGTVYLSGGYVNERISITKSGFQDHPVTITTDPAERGFVDGGQSNPAGAWRDSDLIYVTGNDITWDGVEIRNSPWNGIDVAGHRFTLRNTKIHDIYMQPVISGGDDALVEYNEVFHSELCNENNAKKEQFWGSGIGSRFNNIEKRRSRRFTVRHNKVYDTWGESVAAFMVDGFTVADNDIVPPTAVGIYTDSCSDGVVERNYVHAGGHIGLAFASEPYAYLPNNPPPHDITWRNNVLDHAGDINFLPIGRKTYSNLHFVGNTIVGGAFYVGHADEGGVTGCEFVDNVFDGDYFETVDVAGWSISYNQWVKVKAQGDHGVTGSPQYASPQGGSALAFRPSSTSPARGAGVARADLPDDFTQTKRHAPPTLGALEAP